MPKKERKTVNGQLQTKGDKKSRTLIEITLVRQPILMGRPMCRPRIRIPPHGSSHGYNTTPRVVPWVQHNPTGCRMGRPMDNAHATGLPMGRATGQPLVRRRQTMGLRTGHRKERPMK